MRTQARPLIPLLALLLVSLAGCGDDLIGPVYPEDVEFAPETEVDLDAMTRLQSGVYVQTLEAGQGLGVGDGTEVVLDYSLRLSGGRLIEQRQGVGFLIASGAVIDGFYLGMQGAREGETRLIVIPSHLGYGEVGSGQVPGGAVLVFKVTVVEVDIGES